MNVELGTSVAVDAANLTVTAAAGTSVGGLARAVAARGFRPPLPASGPALSVGAALTGNTGDGAMRAAVRDTLLAVRAVLPDGPPVRFGSNAVKDVAGYDLKRLYTGGGEGFGAVEEVTLRMTPAR